ncbi:hypothetical protein UCRPC4_g01724 [Phaeomoniella chlamydospora]|uniref:Sugar phosphate phosphatase n=1 Tax=Phaeomoniella chlamydospora TaxID=158046 RepID=A0A0G2HA78_PHACM|nr:hypothetical protein UCRPC4_g01724 [Phaeomoniella chlamydospora]
MELDTKTPPCHTSDETSFAYTSAKDRWPTGAIDDVHRTTNKLDASEQEKIEEGNGIIKGLAALKYELQHNRSLTPLASDGAKDIDYYNEELSNLPKPVTWFNVPWLYAECYLYRRMRTLFAPTKHWRNYDVFDKQKIATFKSSRPAVLELAAHYRQIITKIQQDSNLVEENADAKAVEDAERVLFKEMIEICLWGNATDLSLLTNLSYEDIQKLQGTSARKSSEKNILVNDLDKAFDILSAGQKSKLESRRVDIVLDNAGFELYVDLLLSGYLLATGLATEVVLHPKNIPWFVSDVLPKDFAELLNVMADPQKFYTTPDDDDQEKLQSNAAAPLSESEQSAVRFLFSHWSELHADGKLIVRPNIFWTEAGSYWRLPSVAPELYSDLKESSLVIFKGDLNYRKLTGDANWDPTTPFSTAIGPLGSPSSGIRVLALRTCKADVVVGLPQGKDEELKGEDKSGARKWAWTGKWAVVQFCDGKK